MPSADKHFEQYNHNKSLLNSSLFDPNHTSFRDWVITIVFYCAVHLIERELASNSLHSGKHSVRSNAIARFQRLRQINPHYNTIYNQSRRARYECCQFSKDDISSLVRLLHEIEQKLVS